MVKVVEAGGVELRRPVENTQLIENTRHTTRKKRRNSSSDVHGVYTEFLRPKPADGKSSSTQDAYV